VGVVGGSPSSNHFTHRLTISRRGSSQATRPHCTNPGGRAWVDRCHEQSIQEDALY
jgi:hypothetical protein